MDISFKGKNALVTGGGRGIGKAIALKLVELGAHVVVIDIIEEDLATLKSEVPEIETRLQDIADWDKTRKVVEDLGPIHLLVNNAGLGIYTPVLDVGKEELSKIHDINFKAGFNISQVVDRGMVARGDGGAIVNMASVCGKRAYPDLSAYCCSKAAINMMTMTFALELGPHKIRVNSVGPTVVMTEMGKLKFSEPDIRSKTLSRIPLGRFAETADVVNATVFLLSDNASMISGTMLPVDGAMLTAIQ